ncbi:MAG: type II secretion system F family protein [Candidatus Aenigmarchaeota archaeon]|nr:type II secretion system F family protein [Candidatus Aenigmarchaeota archaeon]
MPSLYERMAKASFGWLADKTVTNFEPLKPYLKGARIKMLIKAWVGVIYLSSLIAFFASLAAVVILGMLYDIYYLIYLIMLVFIPILGASFTFLTLYVYPMQKAKSRAKSIENNLPFAVTHMSAIASSGIPPEFMFSLIGGFREYGEISEEANMIVRNIRTFGSSSIAAMKNVANQTPSKDLKEILMGISSTIETGGNLTAYLREMSEKALFDYRIKREKYIKTLSTYADIYTALLVAAPLFLLSTMAIMSIIGGDIMGLTTGQIVTLMTWLLLPVMNTAFLAFIHITYPGV